jgi:phosphoglycolate phosphatase-like HAD superfamily hydrolase
LDAIIFDFDGTSLARRESLPAACVADWEIRHACF